MSKSITKKREFTLRQDKHELVYPEWLIQPKESPAMFDAFQKYRDMGKKRSIRAVAELIYVDSKSKSKGRIYLENVSLSWRWQERIKAFVKYTDEIYIEQMLKDQKEIIHRQAQISKSLINVLLEPYNALVKKVNSDKKLMGISSFENKTIDQLYDLVLKSVKEIDTLGKIERIVKGINPEVTNIDITTKGEKIKRDIKLIVVPPHNPDKKDE